MATQSDAQDKVEAVGSAEAEYDAFFRAKVRIGLEQSRDRSKMIPIEQVWRDLTR